MKKIIVYVLIICTFLCENVFAVANENFSVKDIAELQDGYFMVLMKNGNLYKSNSIDTGKPELVAEDVMSIESYISNTYIEVLGILVRNSKKVIDEHVRRFYPRNFSDKPKYIISTSYELMELKTEGNKSVYKSILTDVEDIIYNDNIASNLHLIVLRKNGDLFCLQNINKDTQNLVRICGDIESIDKVAVDGHYLTYINRFNNAFYCYLNKANITPIKYHNNASEVFLGGGSGTERTLISKDAYVESFPWTTETTPRSRVYGYTKVITLASSVMKDNFFEDIQGRCCIYNGPYTKNPVFDVYNVKKAVELDDSYLFLTEDGKLYGAFEDKDASVVKTFETIFSQKRIVVKINKKEVALKDKIQIVEGRSMYPFRECLEKMGATVYYDSANHIAIGEYNGIKIEFPINRNEYWINGVKYEMDVSSYIDPSISRTYIPIRYAAEGLGFTVDWKEGTLENIIDIYK